MLEWTKVLDMFADSIRDGIATRIILWGPPGTGKSAWPVRRWPGEVTRYALTEETMPEDLLGQYTLRNGDTVWVDGPASDAVRNGHVLVLDEIDRAGAACESLLHSLLDDPEMVEIPLPNGEVISPAKGYAVFATSNKKPTDLGEAILDRFDLVLQARMPNPEALDTLPNGLANVVSNAYKSKEVPQYAPSVTMRRALAYTRLTRRHPQHVETITQVVWGAHAEEIESVMAQANDPRD